MKNLIFDLGGVLINYDLAADTQALTDVGLPLYSQWAAHPELAAICNPYLNGLLSEPEFCERLRPHCRPGVTDEEMIWSMMAVMADLPASRLATLCELRRQGYRLLLLSNINERTWQYALSQFARAGYRVEQCFDDVFLSFEMGLAKPDVAIFSEVLRRAGIQAEDSLFLDDTRENIEAARSLGIESWLIPMNEAENRLEMLKDLKNQK